MKNKLVGLKTVKQELKTGDYRKLTGLAKNRRLDIDAARYLVSAADSSINISVIRNYRFSELFESLTDFFCSPAAYNISKDFNCSEALEWFDVFYTSSEEMMREYNSMDESAKEEFVRYIYYRQTAGSVLNIDLRDNFINCIEAIADIAKARVSFRDGSDMIQRIVLGLPFIGKDALKKVIKKAKSQFSDEEVTRDLDFALERRFSNYADNISNEVECSDMIEALAYMCNKQAAVGLIAGAVYHMMDESSVRREEDRENLFLLAKEMYDKHLHDAFTNKEECIKIIKRNNSYDNYKCVFFFEKREDVKDRIFTLLGKAQAQGFGGLLRRIVLWHTESKKGRIELTKKMCDFSSRIACCQSELFLDKKLSSADEIINYFEASLPVNEKFAAFNENRYLYENIRLEELSKTEFDKIKPYLHMDCFGDYFESRIIPFSFIEKEDELIKKKGSLKKGIRMRYTMEQLQWLLDEKRGLLDQRDIELIITYGALTKNTDEKQVAKMINTLGEKDVSCCIDFISGVSGIYKNKNLSLEKILTYIN